jgi:iron complex outermembrane receptor protein
LTSKGAELEVRSVFNGFEVDYSFGYTNATYKKLMISQNNTEVNLQGNHQLFTPKITSLLAAQYSISLNRKQNLRLLLSVSGNI